MREREGKLFTWAGNQPDSKEGVLSFLEKRAPSVEAVGEQRDAAADFFSASLVATRTRRRAPGRSARSSTGGEHGAQLLARAVQALLGCLERGPHALRRLPLRVTRVGQAHGSAAARRTPGSAAASRIEGELDPGPGVEERMSLAAATGWLAAVAGGSSVG